MKLRQGFCICNCIFSSGFSFLFASFLFAFLLKRKEKEEPALLHSISVIISGFSFCLRRGTFVGRKYPKASAFLKESSQRTKNIFPCCPSPVSLSRRCSEFSMVVLPRLRRPACAFAPRTPCFILLAPFYQRIRLAGIRR